MPFILRFYRFYFFGLSVLHMHETMIKIVCWLSFVFKFLYIAIYHGIYIIPYHTIQELRIGPDNGLFHFDPFATFVFAFSLSLTLSLPIPSLLLVVWCFALRLLLFYVYSVCRRGKEGGGGSIGHDTRISANGSVLQ